jgi:hypothetical protein
MPLGPIALIAHRVTDGRVTSIGLRLAEEEIEPTTFVARLKKSMRDLWSVIG